MDFPPTDVAEAIETETMLTVDYQLRVRNHTQNYLEVFYEDLLESWEPTFARVLDFISPPNHNLTEYHDFAESAFLQNPRYYHYFLSLFNLFFM